MKTLYFYACVIAVYLIDQGLRIPHVARWLGFHNLFTSSAWSKQEDMVWACAALLFALPHVALREIKEESQKVRIARLALCIAWAFAGLFGLLETNLHANNVPRLLNLAEMLSSEIAVCIVLGSVVWGVPLFALQSSSRLLRFVGMAGLVAHIFVIIPWTLFYFGRV